MPSLLLSSERNTFPAPVVALAAEALGLSEKLGQLEGPG